MPSTIFCQIDSTNPVMRIEKSTEPLHIFRIIGLYRPVFSTQSRPSYLNSFKNHGINIRTVLPK